jgi:hypothetical protein
MMVVTTATPATAPPAIAAVLELLPVGSGVGVDDPVEDGCREEPEDVAVVDTLGGPMSEPGRTSGVSIKKGGVSP